MNMNQSFLWVSIILAAGFAALLFAGVLDDTSFILLETA